MDDFDGENNYDNDFDAGVEADESEDPKKYIQQLSGKLSQSIRKYNDNSQQIDTETNKYAAGMVNNAVAKVLSNKDINDIIDKLKNKEAPDNNEEDSDFNDELGGENDYEGGDFESDDEQDTNNMNNIKNESINKDNLSEIINNFIDNMKDKETEDFTDDSNYISSIFKPKSFK